MKSRSAEEEFQPPLTITCTGLAAAVVPLIIAYFFYCAGTYGFPDRSFQFFREYLAFPGLLFSLATWFVIVAVFLWRRAFSVSILCILGAVFCSLVSLALIFFALASLVFPDGLIFRC